MAANLFIGLTVSQLQTLQTEYLACFSSIATAHQNYSVSGRTFTRADVSEVAKILNDIGNALSARDGAIQRMTYAGLGQSQ